MLIDSGAAKQNGDLALPITLKYLLEDSFQLGSLFSMGRSRDGLARVAKWRSPHGLHYNFEKFSK